MNDLPTVWIVDDDTDDQLILEEAFNRLTPPIRICKLMDGEQLVPYLERVDILPRLILLDLNMPLKNGFETLTELRELPSYKNLPVVIMTTSDTLTDKQRSLLTGADKFFTKPVTYQDTLVLVKELATEWELT